MVTCTHVQLLGVALSRRKRHMLGTRSVAEDAIVYIRRARRDQIEPHNTYVRELLSNVDRPLFRRQVMAVPLQGTDIPMPRAGTDVEHRGILTRE